MLTSDYLEETQRLHRLIRNNQEFQDYLLRQIEKLQENANYYQKLQQQGEQDLLAIRTLRRIAYGDWKEIDEIKDVARRALIDLLG